MCINEALCCVFISAFCLHLGTFMQSPAMSRWLLIWLIDNTGSQVLPWLCLDQWQHKDSTNIHAELYKKKTKKTTYNSCLPRSTSPCRSICQIVSANRLVGADHPLEIVYFVEGPGGQRMPADQAAIILNNMDVQQAAIILGYRVQGVLAQREYLQISGPVWWTKLKNILSFVCVLMSF